MNSGNGAGEERETTATQSSVAQEMQPESFCIRCSEIHPLGVRCPRSGLCQFCNKRSATIHFGDMLLFTHGGGLNCCEICATENQLYHARERAAKIPELEATLARLRNDDGPSRRLQESGPA